MAEATVQVKIIKKADDPLGLVRVSLGMGTDPDGKLFAYCVYRGSKENALNCIYLCHQALNAMAKNLKSIGEDEPEIEPDDGKQYA